MCLLAKDFGAWSLVKGGATESKNYEVRLARVPKGGTPDPILDYNAYEYFDGTSWPPQPSTLPASWASGGYIPGMIARGVERDSFYFTISGIGACEHYELTIGKIVMDVKWPGCGR